MRISIALSLMIASAPHAAAWADDDPRIRFMAANCAYCHGPDGHSRGAIPSLAGINAKYFLEQMHSFRDGSRVATVMAKHASGYSEAELEDLAQWFTTHK
jgi:cytochrome c553